MKDEDQSSKPALEQQEKKVFNIYLPEDILEKLKALAYWDRKTVKEVLVLAISEHLRKREPIPIYEQIHRSFPSAHSKEKKIKSISVILPRSLTDKVKSLAYSGRKAVVDIWTEAVDSYLSDKDIKPIP